MGRIPPNDPKIISRNQSPRMHHEIRRAQLGFKGGGVQGGRKKENESL